ncbi:unnamed protein product [Microthlaspi erraticum]|uniref:BHLH domain-containing protein n=1 Tax=Microthlaspi erraticum TaxID=1685480 RepID=A0A6D2J7I4_9BRAS|nr:unnamed protein product [Microthlaspi erraticum]
MVARGEHKLLICLVGVHHHYRRIFIYSRRSGRRSRSRSRNQLLLDLSHSRTLSISFSEHFLLSLERERLNAAMDQSKKLKTSDFADDESSSSSSSSGHKLRAEMVVEVVKKEAVSSSRQIQKADREKIRRDKLNEQFLALGNALDPKRPKSDKASIITDTIQMLKDLMNQVDQLKAEYVTLSQESRELIQEKSELREEKSSLKSEIKTLNAQYQQRVRAMVPWIPHYTYPLPVVAITHGPVPIQPFQPFPPNHCSTFIPYSASANPSSSSVASNKSDCKRKSLDLNLMRKSNHSDCKDDVVGLDLELKIHASSSAQQVVSGTEKKGSSTNTSNSSSKAVQDSSSASVNNILKSENL